MKINHLAVISALICLNSLAATDPGDALLNYFGETCTSLSVFTFTALNDSRALMETLRTMRDDKDCISVSGAISNLNNLENKLTQLDNEYMEQLELAKLESQEIELMSQLAKTTDPLATTGLQSALGQVQLDKAAMLADEDLRKEYNGDKLRGMYTGLIKATSAAYDSIASNQLCLDKNPGLLTDATSLVGSIAASSMLINPALGLGVAGLSDIIGKTVEHYRTKGYNSSIKYIANKTTVSKGLACALETLTTRQCDVQDAKEFLKIEEKLKRNSRLINPDTNLLKIKEISDLFDIDLPVLIDWLDKVKAGAPAANSSDARRKSPIYYEEATLKDATTKGQGLFGEKEEFFEIAKDDKEKFTVIEEVIDAILQELPGEDAGPRSGSHPLTAIHKFRYIPYYLMGITREEAEAKATANDGNLKNYKNVNFKTTFPDYYPPKLAEVRKRYESWITEARDRLNRKSAIVLQPDPITIISDFNDRTSNKWKRSPKKALKHIYQFLQENIPTAYFPNRKEMFEDTQKILLAIKIAIPNLTSESQNSKNEDCKPSGDGLDLYSFRKNEIPKPPTNGDDSKPEEKKCNPFADAIETISGEAKLEFGTLIVKNRLDIALRVSLQNYIEKTDINSETENQLAQFLAADSFLDVLREITGQDNTAAIDASLNEADTLTQDNILAFSKLFAPRISYNFRQEEKWFNHPDPDISEPRKKNRAKMCFLLAAIPEWPMTNKGILRHCDGLKLQDYKGGPETPTFGLEFISRSYRQRRCVYQDYLRKNKIYKDWGIKL